MRTTDLSAFDNSWYRPGARPIIAVWYLACRLIFNTSVPYPSFLKRAVLRIFGAAIGSNVLIKPRVNIKYPWFLTIGNNVWIGEDVWIDNLARVSIASNVCISQGAMLLCGSHNYKKSAFDLIVGEIVLEEGVWIGAKSIVSPGITCGDHSVLAVGSVATCDMEPHSVYQGNPAVRVKARILDS